jgi:hypothetical protein
MSSKILLVCTVILILALGFSMPLSAEEAASDAKAEVPSGKLAPLRIELPEPMFQGTPPEIRTANLEKQTGKARGPFLAPNDAVIVSLNKDAISSDDWPVIGETDLLTDGDKEAGDGSFVEYGPGVQFVQLDLGESHELYAVLLWHYHMEARVYRDVVVRIADDEDFITNVRTLFNNDHDNSSGLGLGKDKEYIETRDGKLVDGKKERARYIRLYSNGNTTNDMNNYNEVEVWGKANS